MTDTKCFKQCAQGTGNFTEEPGRGGHLRLIGAFLRGYRIDFPNKR